MNYSDVQRIFDVKGLNNILAFKDVNISIAPIQSDENGITPLGLYYPDEGLIIVPPDLPALPGSIGESVLLHELGHRYGHFYKNDISEPTAEKYRSKYQERSSYEGAVGMSAIAKVTPCMVCKAPEYLCPHCEYGGHTVIAEYGSGIAVADVAVITGGIQAVEVRWNGQAVTKVPVGQNFNIRAIIQATNPGGGQWEIGLTSIEIPATGDFRTVNNLGTLPATYAHGKNNGVSNGIGPGYFDLTDLGQLVMPDRDVRLRVVLWGYPFWNGPAIDRSNW